MRHIRGEAVINTGLYKYIGCGDNGQIKNFIVLHADHDEERNLNLS